MTYKKILVTQSKRPPAIWPVALCLPAAPAGRLVVVKRSVCQTNLVGQFDGDGVDASRTVV